MGDVQADVHGRGEGNSDYYTQNGRALGHEERVRTAENSHPRQERPESPVYHVCQVIAAAVRRYPTVPEVSLSCLPSNYPSLQAYTLRWQQLLTRKFLQTTRPPARVK